MLSRGGIILTVLVTVLQAMQGSIMSGGYLGTGENYLYSVGLFALAIAWLARGMMAGSRVLRMAGLGNALSGLGWAYGRVLATAKAKRAISATENCMLKKL